MSSQICLKWNSFLSNIATSFESLWEEEGLVDVTLASDGQCLTAHKVILSASSPFFKKVFQANPCQHPVIILQDVHFSELEALLIFIYKGEVNIEQKNLPALLKAAETLQVRGLSGGDIFAKEPYKRLAELEQAIAEDIPVVTEGAPKKKQKVHKQHNNSILEKALTPRILQSESTSESNTSEHSGKDADPNSQDALPDPLYHRLEMKIEPLEMTAEDLEKRTSMDKDGMERLDTGQADGTQGSSKPAVTIIAEARQSSSPSTEPSGSERCPSISSLVPEKSPEKSPDRRNASSSPISGERTREESDELEHSSYFPVEHGPGGSRSSFSPAFSPVFTPTFEPVFEPAFAPPYSASDFSEETIKAAPPSYPPFPCPFCDRAYTSWGFRRRHIKAVHTISPSLNCKWCSQVQPTHAAWRRHVVSAHNLSANDAHNGLLILEEAHMVLQIARPTRLDTLVNIIKQTSQQNDHSQLEKD